MSPVAAKRLRIALKIAVAIGGLIDLSFGGIALFFEPSIPALFDVPLRDPATTTLLGGEVLVAAGVYLAILLDLDRFAPLLYVAALDQGFAALLPGLEILRGHLPSSPKIVLPIPVSAVLAAIYVVAAVRLRRTSTR